MSRRAAFLGMTAIACAIALTVSGCGGNGGGHAASVTTTRHSLVADTGTTAPEPDISRTDFRNYSYLDQACGTRKAVKMTSGAWRQDPASNVNFCGMSITAVADFDVTGDGVADAVVTGSGSYGGGTALSLLAWSTVFVETPTGPVNRGYFNGTAFPPYSTADGITVWSRHLGPNDPDCCPSMYQKTTYVYAPRTGTFTQAATTLVPASEYPGSTSTSSTSSSPAPTSPPASTPVGSAPCSYAAILAAINTGRAANDRDRLSADGFHCAGIWAVAFPDTVDDNEVTVLLKWNGKTWQRSIGCNSSLPAPIYPDCFSN